MAEPPKMTEFEKVLAEQEKEQKQEPRKVRKVQWPAPGTVAGGETGTPHGKTPSPIGAPKLAAVPSEKPGEEHAAPEKGEERKPSIALIAALVLVLIIGGVVFMVVRGKGGSETPAEQTDTAVQQPAPPPQKAPSGGAPAPARPSGGGASAPAAKSSAPTSAPAQPQPKKDGKTDVPRPSEAKVSKEEIERLEYGIKNEHLTYENVVEIVGGEGRKLAEDNDQGGNLVQVYEWPGEGLEKEYVHLKFVNGKLTEINLH